MKALIRLGSTWVWVVAGLLLSPLVLSAEDIPPAPERLSLDSAWVFSSWTQDPAVSSGQLLPGQGWSGGDALEIRNSGLDDGKFVRRLEVQPDSWYRVRLMVRCQGVGSGGLGANVSALGILEHSQDFKGNRDWSHLEVWGLTGPAQTTLDLSLRLGGYSATNSGSAWFSDLEFEKLPAPPAGADTLHWYPLSPAPLTQTAGAGPDDILGGAFGWYAFLVLVLVFSLAWLVSRGLPALQGACGVAGSGIPGAFLPLGLKALAWPAAFVGFGLVRLGLAVGFPGYPEDMACFSGWADTMAQTGPLGFYNAPGFVDYPPLYLLVLWPLGLLQQVFPGLSQGAGQGLLLKIPALVADGLLAWLVWRRVRGFSHHGRLVASPVRQPRAAFLALLVWANPLVWFDSAAWGQMDSVLVLFMVLALLALEGRRLERAAVWYALALLCKPQAIFLAPLALAALVQGPGGWKARLNRGGRALASFVLTVLVVVLPFGWNQGFDWIFRLYYSTLDSYPWLSLNASNLWAALGLNFLSLEGPPGQVLGTLASILTLGLILGTTVLVFRSRRPGRQVMGAWFIYLASFMLGPRMHERYGVPAALLGFLAWAFVRDWRILASAILLSLAGFASLVCTLMYRLALDTSLVDPANLVLLVSSWVNLAALALAGWTLVEYMVVGDRRVPRSGPVWPLPGFTGPEASLPLAHRPGAPRSKSTPGRVDLGILAAVTLAWGVLAFADLGSLSSPQTWWNPKAGDHTLIDLRRPVDLVRLDWYWGLGSGRYRLEWSLDGQDWQADDDLSNDSIWVELRWRHRDCLRQARYLRITCLEAGQELKELAFWAVSMSEPQAPGAEVEAVGAGKSPGFDPKLLGGVRTLEGSPTLVDEAASASWISNYHNGMYFDEVYHARAAMEYRRGRDSSENTHPPLGKLIIAAGMGIFGETPFGWRFMGTLAGLLMIPLLWWIAWQFFGSPKAAHLTAALWALDGMHFAQTRIATIDSYGLLFILLSYGFMLSFMGRNCLEGRVWPAAWRLLASGATIALGIASKWIALYAGAGLLVFWLAAIGRNLVALGRQDQGGAAWYRALVLGLQLGWRRVLTLAGISVGAFVALPLVVYVLAYLPYMRVNGTGLAGIWANQVGMWTYHATLEATHSFASRWFEWPFMKVPMFFYSGKGLVSDDLISSIWSLGNPVLWYGGTLGLLWYMGRSLMARRPGPGPGLAGPGHGVAAARVTRGHPMAGVFLAVGALAQILPWALIPRQLVFIYHYFATVPFAVLALVHYLQYRPRAGRVVLVLSAVCFVWLFPVLDGLPVPQWFYAPLHLCGSWPW